MSYFDISGATFDENLRKLETSDPAHADVFNALLGQLREAVINMATMCVEGCKAVCAGKKWKLVANPDVYKHEKWKDAEWA